jgi:hypothetical protein
MYRNSSIIVTSIDKRRITAMLLQRRISWNAALRDIRSDRIRVAPGVVSARSLIRGLNCIRRTCFVTAPGAFDCAAIMASAVEAAKAHQLRTGAAWYVSMSVGLTAAWQVAKAARLSVMTREHPPAERVRETSRNVNLQPVRGEGEGSAANYGGASLPLSPSLLTRPPVAPFT